MSSGGVTISPISNYVVAPPESVLTIVGKRKATWRYLERVHQGGMAWYNTVILTEAELRKNYTEEKLRRRTMQYFLLGTSLATVLDIPNVMDCARALNVLMQEYDYFIAQESKSKSMFFRSKAPDGRPLEESGEYTQLEVRGMPFNLDYVVTFTSLCGVIAQIYEKLAEQEMWNPLSSEMFSKIDNRFKKILVLVSKELDAIAREGMVEELNAIDPLGAIGDDWDA